MAKDTKAPMAPTFESDLRLEYTAQIIADRVNAGKKLPLSVMLDTMDKYEEQQNHAAAAAIAVQAAPYVHPKLRDLVISGGVQGDGSTAPIRVEVGRGMSKLSAKELDQLEKLLAKAAQLGEDCG